MPSNATLPYEDVSATLIDTIYDLLAIIYGFRFGEISEEQALAQLIARSSKLNDEPWSHPPRRLNPHVLRGISTRHLADELPADVTWRGVPRIAKLCLEAVARAQSPVSETEQEENLGIFVPSPLSILTDLLTVPEYPESVAYGTVLSRAILFGHFRVSPSSASPLPQGWVTLGVAEVQDILESFRIYVRHRDNIHYSRNDPARAFLAHFLASQGALVLRFGTVGKSRHKDPQDVRSDCMQFLHAKPFLSGAVKQEFGYEFRLSPELHSIPDTEETMNALFGVPLPLAGSATVFLGGVRRSDMDSLVISVSGAPGTGKTSLALAMAASLAPIGTRCLYCSFEEDPQTLRRRALSVIPQFFRRTSLNQSADENWLSPIQIDATLVDNVASFTREYVSALRSELSAAAASVELNANTLPATAPLLVVIDSLTTIFGDASQSSLESFIALVRELRALNCIVLLLSAEEIPHQSRLEYLVDTVIQLRHEGTERTQTQPVRLLRLAKSRLQMSRPGAHVLHISGDRGVRISPQLPSRLDLYRNHRTALPNTHQTLSTLRPDGFSRQPSLVRIHPRSRVLLHGHGSSGKAALGLRILLSPIEEATPKRMLSSTQDRHARVLVVSFLYPEEYYDRLFKRLRGIIYGRRRQRFSLASIEMQVWALTPSFIGPEDFIGRVLFEIEKAHLEGAPYTGILLDGLHNTFLQFPSLQGGHMVWPALYSLLGRHDLTILTTFTTFSKTYSSSTLHNRDDEEFILQGQLPFLHALVQGTDFLLRIESRTDDESITQLSLGDLGAGSGRVFQISVESALGQRIPSEALVWDRDRFLFGQFEKRADLRRPQS